MNEIRAAIVLLTGKINKEPTIDEVSVLSQAVFNLAQAELALTNASK